MKIKTMNNVFVEYEQEYIECDCGSCIVAVKPDAEMNCNYLSFFKYGHHNPKTFLEKLLCAWRIMRYGSQYADMVVLNNDEVIDVIRKLHAAAYADRYHQDDDGNWVKRETV